MAREHFKSKRGFDDEDEISFKERLKPKPSAPTIQSVFGFDVPPEGKKGPDFSQLLEPVFQPKEKAVMSESKNTEEATVKWFNAEKGFGFVKTATDDLFLHAKVLQNAGIPSVQENQKLKIVRGPGKQPGKMAVVQVVND